MANQLLTTLEQIKSILPIYKKNIIKEIKDTVIPVSVEPNENDIPMVFITGEIPTSKKYVQGEIEYKSKTNSFHAYTYIKLQGNSSLVHPKKNFTIKLYKDKNRSIKLNKEFKNWGAHNDFVLKADYIDILHARNVVSAKLWGKVVKSRSDYNTLPEELRNSPNNGATDGFPIKVFINGKYQGLYNWTIPKSEWMFGINENNSPSVALSAEFNDNGNLSFRYNPCNFNQKWSGIDGDYWSIEAGKSGEQIKVRFNSLVDSIIYADIDLFKNTIDIQSAIDYYIFQDIILGTDGLAKNMILLNYDGKLNWLLSPYDMDATFDLDWNGNILNQHNANFGSVPPFNNKYSGLFSILTTNYSSRIKERYVELRNSVLSKQSIISEFEKYISIFGEDLYIQDTLVYPDIPSVTTNTLNNLREFIVKRLAYLDAKYGVVISNG